mgnify:CR=1 FL=1
MARFLAMSFSSEMIRASTSESALAMAVCSFLEGRGIGVALQLSLLMYGNAVFVATV